MRVPRRFLLFGAAAAVAGPAAAAGPSSSSSSSSQQQAPASLQERLTSAPTYLPLPTFSAGVIHRNLTRGTIVVDVGLDVPDEDLRWRARANAPRIRDALRTALATYASTYYRLRTAPEPEALVRLMQIGVDQVLGASGARVLLANVIYQRRSS